MRIVNTLNMFLTTRHLPGNVIECGVSKGTTTFPLLDLMSEATPGKKLYACDTYEGLPYDDEIKNGHEMKKGECNGGNFFKKIAAMRQSKYLIMVEGLVEETLPKQLADETFCFAWIDMDLYLPTSFATKFLMDRIVKGGVIGYHDYKYQRCPGIEIVVDKEIDYKRFEKVFLANNCIYLRKIV